MVDTGAGSIRRASSHETSCKLIHVRLSDQDRTGIHRLLNSAGSLLRRVRESWTSGSSGKPFHIDVVFHCEGDTEERPVWRPRSKFASVLQGSLFRNKIDPDMVVPGGLDPFIDQANDILGTSGSRFVLPSKILKT